MQDGLTLVLEKIRDADALILGSPIYFGTVIGMMRCFMERMMFPYLTYTKPPASLFPKIMPTAFIYTMNVSEQQMKEIYVILAGPPGLMIALFLGEGGGCYAASSAAVVRSFCVA